MGSFIVATEWAKGILCHFLPINPSFRGLSMADIRPWTLLMDSGRCWNRDGVLLVTAILNRQRDPRL